jgi:beta-RFAP synthase
VISITTGRRLHFGLFTPVPVPRLDLAYGGVGVMIDVPGISLTAEESGSWSVEGPQSTRVHVILQKLQSDNSLHGQLRPHTFRVKYAAPAHQGWGTGTQLALAVAKLWYHLTTTPWSLHDATERVGRGVRSNIGVVGFEHPGLIYDEGKRTDRRSSQETVARLTQLPAEWTWLLIEPRGEIGLHSDEERAAFSRLPTPDVEVVKRLQHLGESLYTAAVEADFQKFAVTLTEYNRLAGSLYESVQGGVYGSASTAARIAHLQSLGALGVGQSSWGPGIFAVFPDDASAEAFKSRLELPNCAVHWGKASRTSPRVDSSPAVR